MSSVSYVSGEAPPDFDALMMQINAAAALLANIAMAANISTEALRAEYFARQTAEIYDDKLTPLLLQLRARLATANPLAGARS